MDGIWQRLSPVATDLIGTNADGASSENRRCPVTTQIWLGSYLTVEMNARHALAGTLSTYSLRFWVSRTITVAGTLATSTHSPPFAPE
jgi:hypothetical protein